MTDKTTENFTCSLTENFSILKHSMLFNKNYSSNNRNCMTVLRDVAEKLFFMMLRVFTGMAY